MTTWHYGHSRGLRSSADSSQSSPASNRIYADPLLARSNSVSCLASAPAFDSDDDCQNHVDTEQQNQSFDSPDSIWKPFDSFPPPSQSHSSDMICSAPGSVYLSEQPLLSASQNEWENWYDSNWNLPGSTSRSVPQAVSPSPPSSSRNNSLHNAPSKILRASTPAASSHSDLLTLAHEEDPLLSDVIYQTSNDAADNNTTPSAAAVLFSSSEDEDQNYSPPSSPRSDSGDEESNASNIAMLDLPPEYLASLISSGFLSCPQKLNRPHARVGPQYQAVIVDADPEDSTASAGTLVWNPDTLPSEVVDAYLVKVSDLFEEGSVSEEKALKLLHDQNYNVDMALSYILVMGCDLKRDQLGWTDEDKRLFEAGFTKYEKDFNKIQSKKLPHKSMALIMEYYLNWRASPRYKQFLEERAFNSRPSFFPWTDWSGSAERDIPTVSEHLQAQSCRAPVGFSLAAEIEREREREREMESGRRILPDRLARSLGKRKMREQTLMQSLYSERSRPSHSHAERSCPPPSSSKEGEEMEEKNMTDVVVYAGIDWEEVERVTKKPKTEHFSEAGIKEEDDKDKEKTSFSFLNWDDEDEDIRLLSPSSGSQGAQFILRETEPDPLLGQPLVDAQDEDPLLSFESQ